jgi:nucleoporin POM152
MSPISTALLNPYADTFCLDPHSGSSVLIPILLNNTNPMGLRYTLTPMGNVEGEHTLKKIETIDLSAKDLKAIEQARLDVLQLTRTSTSSSKLDVDDPDYDEYDDGDGVSDEAASSATLQKTQTLTHIRLSKSGTLRLERVLDTAGVDARLMYPLEITVAPCPRASFVPDEVSRGKDVKCAASGVVSGHPDSTAGEDLKFNINISGVPPLSLRWFKDVNGRREYFTVEGIEGEQVETKSRGGSGTGVAQQLQVPLTVSLDAIGSHVYTLEYVTDRFGNSIPVGPSDKTKSTRSVTVLRRPNVSFKTCRPGHPSSLLIGSETPITISTHEADPPDSPWDVVVKYLPAAGKKNKAWTRTLKTPADKRDLVLRATAPGEYVIQDIRGKYCEGDVLSPETCKVVEMSYPSAEIEWKKIHEWWVIFSVSSQGSSDRPILALETPACQLLLSYTGPHHSKFTTACNVI